MPLFGPPDVDKLKAKGDVKGLIKALGYQNRNDQERSYMVLSVRRAAAGALCEIGDVRAVEPLIAALDDEDADVSATAFKALIHIGAPAVEALITALNDEGWHVRCAAARALCEIGDVRAVEPLIAALKDQKYWQVRRAAAEALGKIGDARAVEPLINALKDEDGDVGKAAAVALDSLAWSPDSGAAGAAYWVVKGEWGKCVRIGAPAVESLIVLLKHRSAHVREAAIAALGKIGDTRAVEPLIARLGDRDWSVRKAAAEALGRLAWSPDSDAAGAAYWAAKGEWGECVQIGARAVEPLIAALRDQDDGACEAAVRAIVQIGAPAVEPLIAALCDEDSGVREAAARALGKIGGARAVEPLLTALKDQKYWKVRVAAAEALGKIGGARAVEPLIAILEDWNGKVRLAAAGGLVAIYRSGRLDRAQKAKLLAQRGVMTRSHHDCFPDCGHTDEGIGVAFPI